MTRTFLSQNKNTMKLMSQKSQEPKKSSTCFEFFSLILILKQHLGLSKDRTGCLPSEWQVRSWQRLALQTLLDTLNNLVNSFSLQGVNYHFSLPKTTLWALVFSPKLKMHNFQPAYHVAQTGLRFIIDPRMAVNSWSSCVYLPNAGIIGTDRHVQVMWCWSQTQGSMHAMQALCQLSQPPYIHM